MKAAIACLLGLTVLVTSLASSGRPTDIDKHAKASERVVVAQVAEVESAVGLTEYGDRIIVSHLLMQVEETMKGPHAASLSLTVEGGTLGDLTLRVSDIPELKRGERAVLFLDRAPSGAHAPHGRGQGILKLRADNVVDGTNVTLNEVRRQVQAALAAR